MQCRKFDKIKKINYCLGFIQKRSYFGLCETIMGFLKKIIKLSFITIIAIIIISIVGEIVIVGKKAFEHSILGTELENDKFIQNTKQKDIEKLVLSNNLKISNRIVNAILLASERYQIDALDLTVIGIIETRLGKYTKTMINSNGTKDRGLWMLSDYFYANISDGCAYDGICATIQAIRIMKTRGFNEWTCYRKNLCR